MITEKTLIVAVLALVVVLVLGWWLGRLADQEAKRAVAALLKMRPDLAMYPVKAGKNRWVFQLMEPIPITEGLKHELIVVIGSKRGRPWRSDRTEMWLQGSQLILERTED